MNTYIYKTYRMSLLASCGALLLGACDLHHPTQLSQNRIQIEQSEYAEEFTVSDLSHDRIETLAQSYNKHGEGQAELTVTYDPHSKTNTAMTATNNAAHIAKHMRASGVHEIRTNILPIHDSGAESKALLSYTAYNALAPKDCTLMPGIENVNIEAEPDYKLGCSTDTIFARQIARPKDLKGQSLSDTASGRRAGNITEPNRAGIPNESLGGLSSTGGE